MGDLECQRQIDRWREIIKRKVRGRPVKAIEMRINSMSFSIMNVWQRDKSEKGFLHIEASQVD